MCVKLVVLICFGWECHSRVIFNRKGQRQVGGVLFFFFSRRQPFPSEVTRMLTLANASRRPRLLTSGSGLQLFHPAGEWDPGLPSASDKGALSPETSGEQKQERIRAEGSTNTALSGFGSRFYSPGLSGNIWLAGRVSITQQFTSRAVNGRVVPSPATLGVGGFI